VKKPFEITQREAELLWANTYNRIGRLEVALEDRVVKNCPTLREELIEEMRDHRELLEKLEREYPEVRRDWWET
jgi:hypothetical protein